MPRPKRTKVAPSAPAPRVRKATKRALQVQTAPPAPKAAFDDLYDVSDSDERARRNAQAVKKGNGKGKAAAGAISRGQVAGATRGDADDIEDGAMHMDLEMGRGVPEVQREDTDLEDLDLGSSSPAMEVGRRDMSTPGGSMLAIGNFKRRARQPSLLGRRPGRARSSSVDSNLAEDNGLMSVGRKNTSDLSMGNFKRPRQRSLVRQNPAPVAQSSMGLEMTRGTTPQPGSALKIGNFKRRAREPSILRTAQKNRQPPINYDDDEDENGFNPEDESTPLNLKTRNVMSSSVTFNPRKRKLSAVQVPRSQSTSPLRPPVVEADETIPATALSEPEEDENQASEREDSPLPSIESRPETPELLSETMAPPHSSSSSPPSSPEPPLPSRQALMRGRRPLRGRTPPPRTQDSPVSSPPSLTHSPNRPATTKARVRAGRPAPPPASTFSTAQLQALLPRRRRRETRDPFDIPSSEDEVDISGLGADDDELSHLNTRLGRRTARQSRTPAPTRKTPAPKSAPKAKQITTKRTYGSRLVRAASDKENQEVDLDDSLGPLPDDKEVANNSPENSQEMEKRVGKELKRAAKKFEEVDKWELEFEEVTASSSSPKDAR